MRQGQSGLSDNIAGASSRRGFLAKVGAAVMGITGAKTVSSLVAPGEAEAYHFCGHIYTTDSCPHPTGLPRIDSKGRPLRAKDGHRVDDLGRLIDAHGDPIDEDGARLTDAEGAYTFHTIRPVAYTGRAPHIHFALAGNAVPRFVTQMYVDGAPENGRDFLLRGLGAEERKRLIVTLDKAGDNAWRGNFDIVVDRRA